MRKAPTSATPAALAVALLSFALVAASCGTASDLGGAENGTPAGTTGTTSGAPDAGSTIDLDEPADEPSATTSSTTAAPTSAPPASETSTTVPPSSAVVRTGAGRLVDSGFAELAGQRVGLIANQTSVVGDEHLIDLLDAAPDVELVAAFAPEHGIRGIADAGEVFDDEFDPRTGTVVFSLYGQTRTPTPEMLEGIDVMVFDLQDVGTRYYTYISTMGLAMRAAADAGISFMVLDRPNPHGGDQVSGFVRDADLDSFIAQYPIPTMFGMTSGELAFAIKGEGWLGDMSGLDLTVIELSGWERSMAWPDTELDWIGPSPGLPTVESGLTYPATVFFEATTLSYGTGTERPFSAIGAPWLDGDLLADEMNALNLPGVTFEAVTYTPMVIPNVSVRPRYRDEEVYGVAMTLTDPSIHRPVETGMHLVVAAQRQATAAGEGSIIDRPAVFDLLSGSPRLRRGLQAGVPVEEIVGQWEAEVATFVEQTSQYYLHD